MACARARPTPVLPYGSAPRPLIMLAMLREHCMVVDNANPGGKLHRRTGSRAGRHASPAGTITPLHSECGSRSEPRLACRAGSRAEMRCCSAVAPWAQSQVQRASSAHRGLAPALQRLRRDEERTRAHRHRRQSCRLRALSTQAVIDFTQHREAWDDWPDDAEEELGVEDGDSEQDMEPAEEAFGPQVALIEVAQGFPGRGPWREVGRPSARLDLMARPTPGAPGLYWV